jgi:hypothetical protein
MEHELVSCGHHQVKLVEGRALIAEEDLNLLYCGFIPELGGKGVAQRFPLACDDHVAEQTPSLRLSLSIFPFRGLVLRIFS